MLKCKAPFFVSVPLQKKLSKTMAFLNQTKTVAIMCIVIVVMLGILIWVNKDSIFGGKDSEKKGSETETEKENEKEE